MLDAHSTETNCYDAVFFVELSRPTARRPLLLPNNAPLHRPTYKLKTNIYIPVTICARLYQQREE